MSALLDDGPVLILCPSTLTFQWQVELNDRLGVPSAVWLSTRKEWVDQNGHVVKTRGAEDIVHCPFRIAIVSTGLIVHGSDERNFLLRPKFGTAVLDEAHRARRAGSLGNRQNEPNNLLAFMLQIGHITKNLLLGTATPIQTEVSELWDLLLILNAGADFVLGHAPLSIWTDWRRSLPVVKGEQTPADEREAWEWLRNPLPPGDEEPALSLRLQLGIPLRAFMTDKGLGALDFLQQQVLSQTLDPAFFREHNPIVRHTVLRRRKTLEDLGLLERVGVEVHPAPGAPPGAYGEIAFEGLGLLTNHPSISRTRRPKISRQRCSKAPALRDS